MKSFALLALLATGLTTAASAAFTTGFELGYLTVNQDAYWAGRVGWVFKSGASLSHQVEFEVGYTKHSETNFGIFAETTKLVPIMVNYRAETTPANKLGFYFGAGVGQSYVHASFPGSGVPLISDDDYAFAFQAFTGVTYQASPAVTMHAGVKFLRVDNVRMFNSDIEVGNDTALTAGVSIRF